jgi:hypothetical protein
MNAGNDIYNKFDPPNALPYVGTLAGVLVFVGTAPFVDNSAPFFAALSVGVIALLIGLTWPLRRRWLLWFFITVVALAHLTLLISIPLPAKVSYGVAFAPIVGVEVYGLWRLIVWVLRMTEQHRAGH